MALLSPFSPEFRQTKPDGVSFCDHFFAVVVKMYNEDPLLFPHLRTKSGEPYQAKVVRQRLGKLLPEAIRNGVIVLGRRETIDPHIFVAVSTRVAGKLKHGHAVFMPHYSVVHFDNGCWLKMVVGWLHDIFQSPLNAGGRSIESVFSEECLLPSTVDVTHLPSYFESPEVPPEVQQLRDALAAEAAALAVPAPAPAPAPAPEPAPEPPPEPAPAPLLAEELVLRALCTASDCTLTSVAKRIMALHPGLFPGLLRASLALRDFLEPVEWTLLVRRDDIYLMLPGKAPPPEPLPFFSAELLSSSPTNDSRWVSELYRVPLGDLPMRAAMNVFFRSKHTHETKRLVRTCKEQQFVLQAWTGTAKEFREWKENKREREEEARGVKRQRA